MPEKLVDWQVSRSRFLKIPQSVSAVKDDNEARRSADFEIRVGDHGGGRRFSRLAMGWVVSVGQSMHRYAMLGMGLERCWGCDWNSFPALKRRAIFESSLRDCRRGARVLRWNRQWSILRLFGCAPRSSVQRCGVRCHGEGGDKEGSKWGPAAQLNVAGVSTRSSSAVGRLRCDGQCSWRVGQRMTKLACIRGRFWTRSARR